MLPWTLVPADFTSYLQGWRERAQQQESSRLERVQQARTVAERLAELLVSSYGARRVWLVGSLTHPNWFHERSDIDLVCEGVARERFANADVAVWLASEGFEVDLLALEEAPAWLRTRAQREGILLHAA